MTTPPFCVKSPVPKDPLPLRWPGHSPAHLPTYRYYTAIVPYRGLVWVVFLYRHIPPFGYFPSIRMGRLLNFLYSY